MESSPIVGFGVNDHQIIGLMRFIEMISRESNIENDEQVAGIQKCECELIQTQGSYMFILFLIIEFRKSRTIKGNSRTVGQLCNQMLIFLD